MALVCGLHLTSRGPSCHTRWMFRGPYLAALSVQWAPKLKAEVCASWNQLILISADEAVVRIGALLGLTCFPPLCGYQL